MKIARQYIDLCISKDSLQGLLCTTLIIHGKVFLYSSHPLLYSSDTHPASTSHLLLGWWYHHMLFPPRKKILQSIVTFPFYSQTNLIIHKSQIYNDKLRSKTKICPYPHYHSAFIPSLDAAMLTLYQVMSEK